MVDSFTPMDAPVQPFDGISEAPKTGVAGFAASSSGRLVIGGIALIVILAIAGVAVFLFLFAQADSGAVLVDPAPAKPSSSSAVVSEEPTATPRPIESDLDTFVFRNVMKPTVKPVHVTPSTSTTTTPTTGGTSAGDTALDPSEIPKNTLYLVSTATLDGIDYATFIWNGNVYVFPEGGELPGTPWKVLRIEGNTVTMLYGDSQVTLTVGQGITK
jgi:hypothetical protein